MSISFEPYDAQSATMRFRRAPRVRLTERSSVFLLHRAPAVASTASLTLGANMALRHPSPRVRLTDRATAFLLHRAPLVALSGGVPLPTVSVFALNHRGPRIRMATQFAYTSTAHFHRQPRVLLSSGARFVLHRQPRAFIYDGTAQPDRSAFLLQQPVLTSSVSAGVSLSLSDAFSASELIDSDFTLALLDLFTASTRYSRVAEALQALADGVSLADVAQLVLQSDLLDSFIASDLPTFTAQITVMMSDSFDMDDAGSSLAEILAALHDGFYATLTINTGDDTYTAWVMTPQTKAMRSYSNWNFNSYATIGAQFLAAGPAGIYRMGGSTDAGAAIRAAIRTGKMNFGSMAMKGAPLVYIGATTTGDMLLRVQATTVRGEDLEQTYRMTPAVANAPREHRVPVGRGFRSVYWTFELCNDVDGAAFEVHEWHALPVTHPGKLT